MWRHAQHTFGKGATITLRERLFSVIDRLRSLPTTNSHLLQFTSVLHQVKMPWPNWTTGRSDLVVL